MRWWNRKQKDILQVQMHQSMGFIHFSFQTVPISAAPPTPTWIIAIDISRSILLLLLLSNDPQFFIVQHPHRPLQASMDEY